MAQTNSSIDARLTGAETSIKSLEQIVGDLARTMNAGFARTDEQLSKAADNTDRKLSEIERAIALGGRTPWNVIISGAGVAVVVLASLGGLAAKSWVDPLAVTVNRNTVIIDGIQAVVRATDKEISDLHALDATFRQVQMDILRRLDLYDQTRASWPVDIAVLRTKLEALEKCEERLEKQPAPVVR